ncbi:MAG: hypothetical protein PHO75_03845 [Candidatus Shapirobacteria bacterium]|nr:hypothetical protein [Candidatus Shapirobacteria bacterium]
MKKCKSCQKEIDDKAKKCPHCHSDQRNWFLKHKFLTGILIIILIVVISNMGGGKESINQNKQSNTQEQTSEETPTAAIIKGYQEIYDEYVARLKSECPKLAMTECAELSNEGVAEMAKYMYSAKGTDGQYQTYEKWSGKLMDVYMQEVK